MQKTETKNFKLHFILHDFNTQKISLKKHGMILLPNSKKKGKGKNYQYTKNVYL